jgi:hypothetical protein
MNVPCSQELIAGLLALFYNATSLRQQGTLLLLEVLFSPGRVKKEPPKGKKARACVSP